MSSANVRRGFLNSLPLTLTLPCGYCGKVLAVGELTVDHVVPRCRGGTNDKSNLVLACGPCNHDKGPLTGAEYESVAKDHAARKPLIASVLREVPAKAKPVVPEPVLWGDRYVDLYKLPHSKYPYGDAG